MSAKRDWYGDAPVSWADKRKAIDEHYAFHYPERYAIENLRKELASAKEQISDLEEQGQTGEALQSLKSRAAMLEDESTSLRR
jgi:hypothetical protein